jgi:hypothetical protein
MSEHHDAGDEKVDAQTKDEEDRESRASHAADRAPTPEEEMAADRIAADPDVAAHERAMGKIGAEVRGEGQVD